MAVSFCLESQTSVLAVAARAVGYSMDILGRAKSQAKALGRGVLAVAGLDAAALHRSTALHVKVSPAKGVKRA